VADCVAKVASFQSAGIDPWHSSCQFSNTRAMPVKALAAIARGVADGDLTPMEAAELSKVVDGYTRAIETTELADRLNRLEQAQLSRRQ
jgi:hypothetical protein